MVIGTFSPVAVQRFTESLQRTSRSAAVSVGRHEVVVVQRDAVGADVGQVMDDVDRVERLAHLDAEGVATDVAYRPETEREAVLGLGFIRARCHGDVTFLGTVSG